VLHREDGQWRIAAVFVQAFPDQDLIMLDFENPEDYLLTQQKTREEMLRRQRAATSQARLPDDPATTIPR